MKNETYQIDRTRLESSVLRMFCDASGNELPSEESVPIFDEPLIGVASASDPLFALYKQPQAIGTGYMAPAEWLAGAQSVVSLFFPLTSDIRMDNRAGDEPSLRWLNGKLKGQQFIFSVMEQIAAWLEAAGHTSVVPSHDARLTLKHVECSRSGEKDFRIESSWSERHAAFACGLGTFGLSRGLITERGMAGRFGSIVTTARIETTKRPYSALDEWCTHCGACARRCPVDAIDLVLGKNNALCESWCFEMDARFSLGDACGKCQVRVPCEASRPGRVR